jgi:activator of HSP90 ATPase
MLGNAHLPHEDGALLRLAAVAADLGMPWMIRVADLAMGHLMCGVQHDLIEQRGAEIKVSKAQIDSKDAALDKARCASKAQQRCQHKSQQQLASASAADCRGQRLSAAGQAVQKSMCSRAQIAN